MFVRACIALYALVVFVGLPLLVVAQSGSGGDTSAPLAVSRALAPSP